jgi:methionyl-tRNA formyltransferase
LKKIIEPGSIWIRHFFIFFLGDYMKIVLFCNGAFALPSIDELTKRKQLEGIVTGGKPHDGLDRIHMVAGQMGIPIYHIPKNEMESGLVDWLNEKQPDMCLVFTFPYKIPESILSIPQHGFFNFHGSLLPDYAGSHPLFWQIKNQEPYTGITVHQMDNGLDSGPIALVEKIPLHPLDTYGMLSSRLAFSARLALINLLGKFEDNPGGPSLEPQDEKKGPKAPQPELKDVMIDWKSQGAAAIRALVNASNPWNKGAYTSIRGIPVRILQVSELLLEKDGDQELPPPGTIIESEDSNGLNVLTKDAKVLRIDIIFLEEGFFPGTKILEFGIKPGEAFI